MITDKRIKEMEAWFWAETNGEWTAEWRDDLTPEEALLIDRWDEEYEKAR